MWSSQADAQGTVPILKHESLVDRRLHVQGLR